MPSFIVQQMDDDPITVPLMFQFWKYINRKIILQAYFLDFEKPSRVRH